MAPWGVPTIVSLTFCILSTTALESCVADHDLVARFEPADEVPGESAWSVQFSATNTLTGQKAKVPLDLRFLYAPFTAFVALVMAAPVPRARRRFMLVGGAVVLALRMLFVVAAPLGSFLGAYAPGSAIDYVSRLVFRSLVESPNMAYATPIVLFLLAVIATAEPRGAASPR
jgi:hypothetical protein